MKKRRKFSFRLKTVAFLHNLIFQFVNADKLWNDEEIAAKREWARSVRVCVCASERGAATCIIDSSVRVKDIE